MNVFSRTSLVSAGVMVLAAGFSAPAHAVLQLAFDINGVPFACVDNNAACDTNPAVGTIQLNNQLFNGVQVNGSIQNSVGTPANPTPLDILSTSSLSIVNTNPFPVIGTAAVSDTDFSAPVANWEASASGTFLNAIGGSNIINWWADPANAQGAGTSTDTPGTRIDTFSFASTTVSDSFSHDDTGTMAMTGPFSMTEQFSLSLPAGGSLTSRGQTEVFSPAVPEPSTWAMLFIGFAGLGFASFRSRRRAISIV